MSYKIRHKKRDNARKKRCPGIASENRIGKQKSMSVMWTLSQSPQTSEIMVRAMHEYENPSLYIDFRTFPVTDKSLQHTTNQHQYCEKVEAEYKVQYIYLLFGKFPCPTHHYSAHGCQKHSQNVKLGTQRNTLHFHLIW